MFRNNFLKLAFALILMNPIMVVNFVLSAHAIQQKSTQSNQKRILTLTEEIQKMEAEQQTLARQKGQEEQKESEAGANLQLAWQKSRAGSERNKAAMADTIKGLQQQLKQHSTQIEEIDVKLNKISNDLKSFKDELTLLQKSESVVEGLKKEGFIPESSSVEKVIDPKTWRTNAIIFIKDENSCPVVAKVFKSVKSFVEEHKAVTQGVSYAELVNELRKNCGLPLPIIVAPRGGVVIEGVGVLLLEKAKGKSLAEYINDMPNTISPK